MRRPSPLVVALVSVVSVIAAGACRSGGLALPPADAIVEGRTDSAFVTDTIEGGTTVGISQAHWVVRQRSAEGQDFWSDIAVLDMAGAERNAKSIDHLTFVAALRQLMASDPDKAAVAFSALHVNAKDQAVRARARIGLTMALSWNSDWQALSRIGADPDTADTADSLSVQAGVERWSRALSLVPIPDIDVPDMPVTFPLRRSSLGTPVVTVRINGHPHEFWLDTGASMTLLSVSVANEAGVSLVAPDTLALGVVAGHIPARAVYIDSLALGPVTARGVSAALVSSNALRLDHRVVNGNMETVQIDGVIGTDLLRHLDIVLDAGAGTITVRKPRFDSRAKRNLYWVGYPVVRLVTSSGRPVLFGLDTGAEGTYVTTALLRKLPDTPVAMRRRSIGGLGEDKIRTEWVARSLSLSDGDYAIAMGNIPVTPERHWTFVTFDGVIGSDVALSSRMHLDFLNGVFDIRRSANAPLGNANVSVGH
ncbi:MAG: retropepsin-like aspartic protease [bacterium]